MAVPGFPPKTYYMRMFTGEQREGGGSEGGVHAHKFPNINIRPAMLTVIGLPPLYLPIQL